MLTQKKQKTEKVVCRHLSGKVNLPLLSFSVEAAVGVLLPHKHSVVILINNWLSLLF